MTPHCVTVCALPRIAAQHHKAKALAPAKPELERIAVMFSKVMSALHLDQKYNKLKVAYRRHIRNDAGLPWALQWMRSIHDETCI